MKIIESHQQRADRRFPYPPKNAVETGLRGDVGGLTAVCVQRHGGTGMHPLQKRIERLPDQTEWQHRLDLVAPSDTDRKP